MTFYYQFKPVNDEPPVAIFEPIYIEINKKNIITNDTLLIMDMDSKPDSIMLQIEELPKHGNISSCEKP